MNYELKRGIPLVLRGPKGCGKSRLAMEIAESYGPYVEIEAHSLTTARGLNDALASQPATLIIDGLPRGEAVLAKLKEMMTCETMRFDPKRGQPRLVKTPNFIFCTGYSDPLPMNDGDRRFLVVDLGAPA